MSEWNYWIGPIESPTWFHVDYEHAIGEPTTLKWEHKESVTTEELKAKMKCINICLSILLENRNVRR